MLLVREVILEYKGLKVLLGKRVKEVLLDKWVSKATLDILDYKGLKALLAQLVLLERKVILGYKVLKGLKDNRA